MQRRLGYFKIWFIQRWSSIPVASYWEKYGTNSIQMLKADDIILNAYAKFYLNTWNWSECATVYRSRKISCWYSVIRKKELICVLFMELQIELAQMLNDFTRNIFSNRRSPDYKTFERLHQVFCESRKFLDSPSDACRAETERNVM